MEEKQGFIQKFTSSRKRLFAAFFIVALVLAVPITISMVNQQQDLRQQAAGWDCTQLLQYYQQYLSNCSGQNALACQIIQTQLAQLNCSPTGTATPSATPRTTISPTIATLPTATPSATASPSPTAIVTLSPTPTSGPLTTVQRIFDFNDDGKINEIDLNILYTGFTVRDGD